MPRDAQSSIAHISCWDRRWRHSKSVSLRIAASKYCVALNSGTSALHLALLAAGIGAGRRGDHGLDDICGDDGRDSLLRRKACFRRR